MCGPACTDYESWLPAGFRERSKIFNALLLRQLQTDLSALPRTEYHCDFTSLLTKICPSAELAIRTGTPFFWLNVYRMHMCLSDQLDQANSNKDPSEVLLNLFASAIDSFFNNLPADGAIYVRSRNTWQMPLPSLGLLVTCPSGFTTLKKVGNRLVHVPDRASFSSISDSDAELPRALLRRPNRGCLIGMGHPILFEDAYVQEIDKAEATKLEEQASAISDALDIVRGASEKLWDQITAELSWYVRIHSDDIDTHRSFTSPQLRGTIFLSDAKDPLRLAEAIVHEFSHDTLNRFLDCEHVAEADQGQLLYSPWRRDPRPLLALLHGLYVFAQVSWFYMAIQQTLGTLDEMIIRKRAEVLWCRLSLAFAQVPFDRLTGAGAQLVTSIEQQISKFKAALGVVDPIPDIIFRHLEQWVADNSGIEKPRMPQEWS